MLWNGKNCFLVLLNTFVAINMLKNVLC